MEDNNSIALVLSSLKEIISEMENNDRPHLSVLNEETRLIGKRAVLTSLGLVSLIVELEQRIDDEYGLALTIADERAMSQERSPFLTVGTLGQYISALIKEQAQ